MENIFQNSLRGIGDLFDNHSVDIDKMMQQSYENPFKQEEKEPVIVFEQSFLKERRINDVDNKLLFKGYEEKKDKKPLFGVGADNIFEKSYKQNSLLKKFFPKLYGRRILRAINKRMGMIEENTKKENTKQIPFGEKDKRYENLAQNLSEINYLQTKLNNEIK